MKMAAVRSLLLRSSKEPKFTACLNKFSTTASVGSNRDIKEDKITHTGQKWDKDDYRLARFVNNDKHVNPNFAIDLIHSVPPKCRTERVVWCDGEVGALGHPRVYINLDKPGNHSCSYCGLRFYKDDHH